MEGESDQALFVAAAADPFADVEEHATVRRVLLAVEHAHDPVLLGDEDAIAAVAGTRQEDRTLEAQPREGALDVDPIRAGSRMGAGGEGQRGHRHQDRDGSKGPEGRAVHEEVTGGGVWLGSLARSVWCEGACR